MSFTVYILFEKFYKESHIHIKCNHAPSMQKISDKNFSPKDKIIKVAEFKKSRWDF